MTIITATSPLPEGADDDVSLARLYVLRATYLLLIVGLGMFMVPQLLRHEPLARGVIPSLLGGVWLLAFIGLRHPLRMIPLLMFELAWKTVWLLDYGLTQWSTGHAPATFAEDFPAIMAGVILMPIVIPWAYVLRHFARQPGARWR
jgi:hypothetical protein